MDELQAKLNAIEQIEERIQELYKELEDEKAQAKKIYQEIGKAYGLTKEKKISVKKEYVTNNGELVAVQ